MVNLVERQDLVVVSTLTKKIVPCACINGSTGTYHTFTKDVPPHPQLEMGLKSHKSDGSLKVMASFEAIAKGYSI